MGAGIGLRNVTSVEEFLLVEPEGAVGWERTRWRFANLIESTPGRVVSFGMVCINAVLIGAMQPCLTRAYCVCMAGVQADNPDHDFWDGLEAAFIMFFVLEIVAKMVAFGRVFWMVRTRGVRLGSRGVRYMHAVVIELLVHTGAMEHH